MNTLKKKIADGDLTLGSWLTLAHPLIPEILRPAGFDWLAVDMEHSSIGLNELMHLVPAIESNSMVPLVRVGENDPNLIKRVMDIGSHGVIVANICSRDEANRAVESVKYPPLGKRGVGLYRAQRYGWKFDDYVEWCSQQAIIVAQIEHIDAVERVDEILSVTELDAFMIGPYDISASLGKPGKFDDPEVMQALEAVMRAAGRHRIAAGFHSVPASADEAKKRYDQGYRFIAVSLDSILLGTAAQTIMDDVRSSISSS